MKKEPEKARLQVEKFLDEGKDSLCALIKDDPNVLNLFLTDATDEDLWRMVVLFRDTDLWDKFLRALLSLSQEVWIQHKLVPERAKKSFEPKEIEEIIHIYKYMGNDGKASPILFSLNYDKYWTHQVEKVIKQRKWRLAQLKLNNARHGLNASGIPTHASEKCLAELTAFMRSSRRRKKK